MKIIQPLYILLLLYITRVKRMLQSSRDISVFVTIVNYERKRFYEIGQIDCNISRNQEEEEIKW